MLEELTAKEKIAEIDPDALLMDGFDEAIIGHVTRCGQPLIVVYDREKCIGLLVSQGMSEEEAEEYFSFNCENAWVGERTPAILCR